MLRVSCIKTLSLLLHTFSHPASSEKGCMSRLIRKCSVKTDNVVGKGVDREKNQTECVDCYLAFR